MRRAGVALDEIGDRLGLTCGGHDLITLLEQGFGKGASEPGRCTVMNQRSWVIPPSCASRSDASKPYLLDLQHLADRPLSAAAEACRAFLAGRGDTMIDAPGTEG